MKDSFVHTDPEVKLGSDAGKANVTKRPGRSRSPPGDGG